MASNVVNKIVVSVSLVIYSYKPKDFKDLIFSLKDAIAVVSGYAEVVLYIVDNNENKTSENLVVEAISSAGYQYEYHYIKTYKNSGYGHAHNLVIKNDTIISDYHIVCNPDIIFFEDTFKQSLKYMDKNENVGLLTPAVYDENKVIQKMCKRNHTFMRVFSRRLPIPGFHKKLKVYSDYYEYSDKDYSQIIEGVEFCTGCFMFFRSDALNSIKGFDERYFLYSEDADITRSILASRWHTVYLPEFKVVHKWDRANKASIRFTLISIVSVFKYFWKWKFK